MPSYHKLRKQRTLWLLAVLIVLACRTPERGGTEATVAKPRSNGLYGYIVMTPAAAAYGFDEDTVLELQPSEVPARLRTAALRYRAANSNADPDAQACTRYFGRHPPYVVLFIFECPTTGMITDNTLVTMFIPDSSGGFTVRDNTDTWGDVEPAWRNKRGEGGGVGKAGDSVHARIRTPS